MLYRCKFVTNSSSTSIIAFGIIVERDRFEDLEENLPEGIDYKYTPYDQVYVHIGFPKISIDRNGKLKLPEEDCMKEKYLVLQKWAKDNSIDDEIGYIEDGWYDG
jgi:hypothetical protein